MTTTPVDYEHLDRMQRRIMDPESYVTEQEFRDEPESEQVRYYNWMRRQIGELADLI